MTRTYPLWALFAVVAAACAALARRRGVGAVRLLVAWLLSTGLLWTVPRLSAYAGSRVAVAVSRGGVSERSALLGFMLGASVGALACAPLGIALSERWLAKAWPRAPALLASAGATALVAAVVLLTLRQLAHGQQDASSWVLVVFPLLGAAPVLGWLIGSKT